ncbi:hypothetical protein DEO72_LG7g1475 [Vigna unguiculata]|uniref:Uncharacterized protein n=1 Tax=Vigna unguiculata TaxID=3917 RepID=A0A4D6MGP9_VIGUN|nr:hypothetical protein DEO72_LG7g1475 [Vigna unguiculata]
MVAQGADSWWWRERWRRFAVVRRGGVMVQIPTSFSGGRRGDGGGCHGDGRRGEN